MPVMSIPAQGETQGWCVDDIAHLLSIAVGSFGPSSPADEVTGDGEPSAPAGASSSLTRSCALPRANLDGLRADSPLRHRRPIASTAGTAGGRGRSANGPKGAPVTLTASGQARMGDDHRPATQSKCGPKGQGSRHLQGQPEADPGPIREASPAGGGGWWFWELWCSLSIWCSTWGSSPSCPPAGTTS